ncbi:MAG: Conserved membrane protein, multidrug efflux associated [candidate division WS6 bacterium GW2011_GWC2_36_7]|uniref:Conserved membrane protein, multidrug efflux associated n=3 Tax=Candidatus Dojkabacteria TaxID=74243 RepID=A0A0G0HVI5_9BACT|nr:MAG: Conserved membrane protein, multidrug efflux associated [candidate division WS6 bacterium GW2011_GWC2_36_7]KKQ16064.1 MAG: Conserved membrane protein, multidrug efflux associated [candidate division WS6 bacterium GW2011_GWF1_36_8]HAM37645.1 hypothetical protein [Patescibacteria group bacterium]
MLQREYKTTIWRYVRIWFLNLRASIKKSNTYKGEIFVRFFRTFFILGIQVLLLTLVFGNSEVYVGWTKAETYLVMGIWNLLNYFGWAFFGINLERLESRVLSGEFDFTLLKPLSSAWFSSFYDFSVYSVISSLSGFVLVGYYFFITWGTLSLTNVLLGVAGIIVGLLFWYAFYLLLSSFTLANPRNGFLALVKEILGLAKYPVNIYSSSIQMVFFTILPIAFVTTVPASLIIGRMGYAFLIIGTGLAILFVRLSYWVWKQNVKKYVSAGG